MATFTLDSRDAFTSFFEAPAFYASDGTPDFTTSNNGNVVVDTWPFYQDQNGHWNFGYGFDITQNIANATNSGVAPTYQALLEAPNVGVPSSVVNGILAAAITDTVYAPLGSTEPPDAVDVNNALSQTTNWKMAAQNLEDTLYGSSTSGFIQALGITLNKYGVTLSSLPTNVQFVLEDIAYNAGPNSSIFANLAPALMTGATTGDFSQAAFQMGFLTSLAPARSLANAARLLGYTVTINSDLTIDSISGESASLTNFLNLLVENYSDISSTIDGQSAGVYPGLSFLDAIDSQAIPLGMYVYGSDDTTAGVATEIGQINNVSISAATLGRINSVFSDADSFAPGGLIHVPVAVTAVGSTAMPLMALSGNYTYVFDPSTGNLYTVGSSLDGSNAGQLIMDTTGLSVPVSLVSDIYASTGSLTLDLVDGSATTSITLNNANTTVTLANGSGLNSDLTFNAGSALTKILNVGTSTEFDYGQQLVAGLPVSFVSNPDGSYFFGIGDAFEPVVDFAPDGLNGDIENVSVNNGVAVFNTEIGNGGTAEVGSSFVVGSSQTNFTFSGVVGSPVGAPTGLLKLDDPWSFNGTIYDAVTGDYIDLVGVKSIQIEQFAGTNDPVFILKNPTTGQIATIRFDLAESYVNSLFGIGNLLGNGDFVLEVNRSSICYLAGTHILTSTGEVLVEDLKIGDLVVTRFSGIQPIKWIGRQSYDSRFIMHNRDHIPVCIRAGALADHMPARDLYVSPGHSMLVGGELVLARSLVNGITITQDNCPDKIHYFQLELESHDCVIAGGAWSETFADGPGLREQFHNAAEFAELYPDQPMASELSLCAPRPEHGPKLDAALRPVVARTAASLTPGPLKGYIDRIEAPWAIVGWAQDTDHPELPVLLEVLLGDRVIATTLACDHRQDLQDAGIGQGRCAFFLTSPIRLRPEMLPTLRVRRVSDGAEIQMTPECRAKIDVMQQTQGTSDLRCVA